MCLGHTHALSGVVTGLAVGSLALHEAPAPLALLAGLTAAYALANDLDSCGSTEARSFGFVTWVLAWLVRLVSGGHRHGTHSLTGIAAFTGVAWLACLFRHTIPGRVALFVILAAGLASAADALVRRAAHAENILALAAAAAMCWTGWGLALVPLAAAVGTVTHLAGDSLTRCGVPLLWPATMHEFHATPRPLWFTTGHVAEDLDLPNRKAKVRRKGGAIDVIVWQTGTARLLPRLLKGRKTGPVFLTDRRARVELPPCDIDQASGRARLSYRQAEDLFKAASGGATLHQLRHSALTHDAEAGASTPMLMAKSGHTSVASLARYARPSAEALARWQERNDPARRR